MKNLYFYIGFITILLIINFNSNRITDEDDNTDDLMADRVFKYVDNSIHNDYTFRDFYLLFDEYNLSTNNFIPVFSFFINNNHEYEVIEIIPYVNPEDIELFKNKRFLYYSDDLNYIINRFSNDYLDIYNKTNKEITINQINIQTVRVNTANKYMKEFLERYKTIKYSTSNQNIYRKLRIEE